LTPEQALVIGAELVDAVLARHATGVPLDGFGAEHVWFGADGAVSLERPGPVCAAGRSTTVEVPGQRGPGHTAKEPTSPEHAATQADLRSTRALLAGLAARATHQPERPGAEAPEVSGAALDLASVTTLLDGDLGAAAARLRPTAAEVGPSVRAELAALIAAAATPAQPGSAPVTRPAARPGGGRGPRDRLAGILRREAERGWTALARLGRWALALVVLLAVLALEVFLLGDRISADLAALRAAGQSSDRGAGGAAEPVAAVAPRTEGAVTGVDLRALARCAPGGDCQLRVLVRLVPEPVARRVQWHYVVLDRCSGSTQRVDGGSVTVAPGGREAAVVGQLSVPAGRALAVTAVVEEPARAASAAVLVPAEAGC
jgi:hypothetical protein